MILNTKLQLSSSTQQPLSDLTCCGHHNTNTRLLRHDRKQLSRCTRQLFSKMTRCGQLLINMTCCGHDNISTRHQSSETSLCCTRDPIQALKNDLTMQAYTDCDCSVNVDTNTNFTNTYATKHRVCARKRDREPSRIPVKKVLQALQKKI